MFSFTQPTSQRGKLARSRQSIDPGFSYSRPKTKGGNGILPAGPRDGIDQGTTNSGTVPTTQIPPSFTPVEFPTIDATQVNQPDFQYTDPISYAQKVGASNTATIKQNWDTSKGMAMDALNTELSGLKGFAAGSSALKREQIALDNPFNQYQRTSQLNQAMPEVAGDLASQRSRANAYASGRLPDQMLDRAKELGIRSSAADNASYAGFGAKSAQSSKVSDLMSADQRFQIGQYGEGLLGSNIQTKANLMLAPTEYSAAGSEIKVMPEVGASRLASQNLATLNAANTISPTSALSAEMGQQQFKTQIQQGTDQFNAQLAQRTNEFNATGQFSAATFNSTGAYTAGANAFQYDVGMANAVAANNQGLLNTSIQMQMAGINQNAGSAGLQNAQDAQTTQGVIASIGAIPGAVNAASNVFSGTDSGATTNASDTEASNNTRAKLISEPLSSTSGQTAPVNSGVDASIPTAIKFAGGMDVPQGYSKVASNADGTYSAVPIDAYRDELASFAAANKVPMESIDVANLAIADRTVANAIGASYQPLPSFQPIAATSSGRQIYSLPAASAGTDINKGAANVANIGTLLGALGVSDKWDESNFVTQPIRGGNREDLYAAIDAIAGTASNPEVLAALDTAYTDKGPGGVSEEIRNRIVGGRTDLSIAPGQQAAAMGQRIGEMWGGLSVEQKSNALASMVGPAMQLRTGRDVNNEMVPGTEKSPVGGLRVGDAISITTQGINGLGLARNWNQLSTMLNMGAGVKDPKQIAQLAHSVGALGYGAQGAAVPTTPGYFEKVGARAAPEYGVGAAVFDKPGHVPPHYKSIGQAENGGTIAMPANGTHTSTIGAGGPTPMSHNKTKSIATGQHPAMRLWGKNNTGAVRGAVRGAAGGSALVNALNQMVTTNPDMAGAMIAHSLFNNLHGGTGVNAGEAAASAGTGGSTRDAVASGGYGASAVEAAGNFSNTPRRR